MSKNKYKPQVWVLPEDDANRQIAQGFLLETAVNERNIEILPVARGWPAIRDSFEQEYNGVLRAYPHCLMVLLVDFDNQGTSRLREVLSNSTQLRLWQFDLKHHLGGAAAYQCGRS